MLGFELAAHGPFLLVGCVVGAVAFAPLLLTLVPVLKGRCDANMAKGILGVAASFVILMLGVVLVHLLFKDVLIAFLAGELVGFFVGWIVVACVVIAAK
jgi:hypothetical protein